MKVLGWAGILAGLVLASAAPATALPELVEVPIRFDVAATELVSEVASVHAACSIVASGESLRLMNDAQDLTTIAAGPGPCSIILTIFGTDVALPIFDTAPLGRNVFYIPGVATLTFGIVGVSVDLLTALNATAIVGNPEAASLVPSELRWPAWGVQRVLVDAIDGRGSVLTTEIETSFTYTISIGLTVYALSWAAYHADLAQIGGFPGDRVLATPLVVDLLPPALTLGPPEDMTADGATFRWTGEVPSDADHMDLWLTDGSLTWSVFVEDPTRRSIQVPLRPDTSYEAWVVVEDRADQSTASNIVAFTTPATGSETGSQVGPLGNPSLPWVVLGIVVLVALLVVAALRTRKAL